MNGTPADGTPPAPDLPGPIRHLSDQARGLASALTGPLRRIQIRHGDSTIDIEWHDSGIGSASPPANPAGAGPMMAGPTAQGPTAQGPTAHGPTVDVQATNGASRRVVVSPIVGTFYRAAEPGGQPFVTVGDRVETGQVIGIVEAMKLMNEITADESGEVAEVLIDDGEPVEYAQPLITLVPT